MPMHRVGQYSEARVNLSERPEAACIICGFGQEPVAEGSNLGQLRRRFRADDPVGSGERQCRRKWPHKAAIQ